MATLMQMLISSFLLLLVFLSFSTSANPSTMKTSSKGQVPCQICISCENPCPVYHPPPLPPVVLCPPPPPPPEPECPPPPPPEPECPPPPQPTCLECVPGGVLVQPQPRISQPGVIGGTVYAPPSSASGTVPYYPYYSASTSNIHRKLHDACSVICLLLATILCFF